MSFSIRRLMCANCLLLLAVIGLGSQAGCRVLRGRGLTKDPTIARELSLQGADALEQHKYSEAETMFAEAVRLSPNDERAHWGLAEVQWQRGERPSATSHMAEAVRLSGGSPDLQVRLGRMFFDQQDYHNALQQSDAALKCKRDDAAAWALKGDVLRMLGDREQALDCYHRALIHRPDWPEIQVAVAEMYQAMNRPERALATLDRLSDQHGAGHVPPRAWVLRGRTLAAMGETAEARTTLRQAALKLGPDNSDLLLEIAQTQMELGDLVEAKLCLGRSMAEKPDNPQALALQSRLDESFARLSSTNMPNIPASWNR